MRLNIQTEPAKKLWHLPYECITSALLYKEKKKNKWAD